MSSATESRYSLWQLESHFALTATTKVLLSTEHKLAAALLIKPSRHYSVRMPLQVCCIYSMQVLASYTSKDFSYPFIWIIYFSSGAACLSLSDSF